MRGGVLSLQQGASIWKKELHPTGGSLSTEKRSIKELVGVVRR